MKIAVVRNRRYEGVLGKLGQPCPERYGRKSVQSVINALRAGGHTVGVFEGDINLFNQLQAFMAPDPLSGAPGGMVFNMAYGIQGEARYVHVPAMLEMAGIPYTGPGPQSHAVALDKVLTKILMERHGIPTPHFCVLDKPDGCIKGLRYPLIVKPRHESTSLGIKVVNNRHQLESAVESVIKDFEQDALVEEYIDGREVAIGLLGNSPIQVLPIVELAYDDREIKILTKPDKFHRSDTEPKKICPAELDQALAGRLNQMAIDLFNLCQCRDYARLDIRIDREGNPFVLEINSMATLGAKGGYVLAARKAGYTFKQLIWHIVDVAHHRYFGRPAPRGIDITGRIQRRRARTRGESTIIDASSD